MILKINDRIRRRTIEFFTSVRIHTKYDSVGSTFSLLFYFDPSIIEHKEMACVGHFHIAELWEGNDLILTGYILSEKFTNVATKQMVSIGGYSLPGVLMDCDIPKEAYPLQSDLLSLLELANKYAEPFGINVVVTPTAIDVMNEPYDQTDAKPTQSIKSILSEIASQKNINVTDDPYGNLVFTKAPIGQIPVFHFNKGMPGVEFSFDFPGQQMHSEITVVKQKEIEDVNESTSTFVNPYVPFVKRPKIIVQSTKNESDTATAAKNAVLEEIKGMTLGIVMDGWYFNKTLVRRGQIILVTNPDVYMYKATRWFILEVEYNEDPGKKVAKLTCVQECVLTGEDPQYIFQGINLH